MLIYGAPRAEAFTAVSRAYLNHWHEAGFVPERPDVPWFVHEADRAETHHAVRATFVARVRRGGDR